MIIIIIMIMMMMIILILIRNHDQGAGLPDARVFIMDITYNDNNTNVIHIVVH